MKKPVPSTQLMNLTPTLKMKIRQDELIKEDDDADVVQTTIIQVQSNTSQDPNYRIHVADVTILRIC
jgi:hypothetical protein